MTKYLFVDVETTGTNVIKGTALKRHNHCMQIAGILTDSEMNELMRFNHIVSTDESELKEMNSYVRDMHTRTGLLKKLENANRTLTMIDAEIMNDISKFLGDDEKLMAVGNNVQFDVEVIRQNFPMLFTRLHYSVTDVSSIRRLIDLVQEGFSDKVNELKVSNHDAMIDIEECKKEFECYMNMVDLNKFEWN